MQKPIDHFQQPILGSHENLQLVCENGKHKFFLHKYNKKKPLQIQMQNSKNTIKCRRRDGGTGGGGGDNVKAAKKLAALAERIV